MFLFYKNIVSAVFLQELIIFLLIFHIVAINHYEIINEYTVIITRKLMTQNSNKIRNCLPVILLKIKWYGVAATIMITKSKKD